MWPVYLTRDLFFLSWSRRSLILRGDMKCVVSSVGEARSRFSETSLQQSSSTKRSKAGATDSSARLAVDGYALLPQQPAALLRHGDEVMVCSARGVGLTLTLQNSLQVLRPRCHQPQSRKGCRPQSRSPRSRSLMRKHPQRSQNEVTWRKS